jgi:hypothetical protein
MSYVTTEIKKYRAAIFPQEGTPAKISLWNGTGQQFAVLFLRPDGESLPDAYEDVDQGYVRAYFHRSAYLELIDLLRNEEPVYFHFWTGAGNNTHLATGQEPVGEGED